MQPMDKAFVVLKKRPVNCETRLQEEKKDDKGGKKGKKDKPAPVE